MHRLRRHAVAQTMEQKPVQIRVVVKRDGQIYRSSLLESEVEKKGGQIVLSQNMYSAGFCERVWDIQWKNLEWLPSSS